MKDPTDLPQRRLRHWQATRRLTAALLLFWAGLSFGLVYQARALNFMFFGWPFSFWAAAQGLLLVYLALIAVYAARMGRLDRLYGLDEQD
jgi:putative solute:sodium symporter small subunit